MSDTEEQVTKKRKALDVSGVQQELNITSPDLQLREVDSHVPLHLSPRPNNACILVTVAQYLLATDAQIQDSINKGNPLLKQYKGFYYLHPCITKHVLFDANKAKEFYYKFGITSKVVLRMNCFIDNPSKTKSTNNILELLGIKIGTYDDINNMYVLDCSELASLNKNSFRKTLYKYYKIIHVLTVHMLVGHQLYPLSEDNFGCIQAT